jgi:hypothetical protein
MLEHSANKSGGARRNPFLQPVFEISAYTKVALDVNLRMVSHLGIVSQDA